MKIDPWGGAQVQDYARLRDEFGIEAFGPEEYGVFAQPHKLFTRGLVFGHRDFGRVADAVQRHERWSVMTGFMPSGDLHLGHKMLMDQLAAHGREGADLHLALADFEAMAARGFTLEKARRVALDQYVHNALALGVVPENAHFYFQTRRPRVNTLAHRFAQKVNWSQLAALYGFGGDTSLAHALAPLVQASDILHPQQDAAGPRPVLVPVGVDQDPHIRLTRDIAQDWRTYSVQQTKEGDVGVFVKADGLAGGTLADADVKVLLDRAEAALRAEGYGELRRHDAYKALYVKHATAEDVRRIDLALARTEAPSTGMAFLRPSATFHRFMTGLQGGKMSSSRPETSVYLTEDPASAQQKVRSAVTGGRATAEEQRRLGAHPERCPVYELYLYHLAKDDAHLQEVHDTCASGARLCGGCKSEAITLLTGFLKEHKEKRDQVAHQVDGMVAKD